MFHDQLKHNVLLCSKVFKDDLNLGVLLFYFPCLIHCENICIDFTAPLCIVTSACCVMIELYISVRSEIHTQLINGLR
jgi:hypothetical protein